MKVAEFDVFHTFDHFSKIVIQMTVLKRFV